AGSTLARGARGEVPRQCVTSWDGNGRAACSRRSTRSRTRRTSTTSSRACTRDGGRKDDVRPHRERTRRRLARLEHPRSDTARRSGREWIDLTWPLSPTVPRLASFPPPRIERIASIPEQPLNVSELSMVVHVGTHVDSPRHFFNDGPALEQVP